MALTPARRRWAWALVVVSAVLALAVPLTLARRHDPTPRGAPVNVLLDDFTLRRDVAVVPAGTVRFRILNEGPTTHELSVIRTDRAPDKLPLQRDGLTINEDAPGMHFVNEAEGIEIGDRRTLALRLAAGNYVLYCNMEGHYLGGMHAALTVS
ncbi:MAG: sulfocyanin-like copper-binding protein [Actinomycetes bacterium]